ncbi:FAD-dependent oxidoreductase [Jiella sp. MQZ9-1]|uniref:FAD-dependent oxidoreductase n=1 Tax=Jiella flava TaxID=2816857 RepID=A0A939FWH3_9HYPH|nr:FAD-dependent oxidoreductase [Jiella flava]MBO0661333.1 FAD-dependent oxidoreductase [Jiella flava]MCD2469978.1 FAD-dependent oxidoreductase [Jiella flava]
MRDIVLIGGGHAHLFVLEAFAKRPRSDIRLTLIAREAFAPYSGMLPGRVSGQYPIDAGEIDLQRLAGRAGARFVHASATRIDRSARRVELSDGTSLAYDWLSLDIGIVPDVSAIADAASHGLIVKPISTFRQRLEPLLAGIDAGAARHLAVVGGGPAGFELAHAVRRRLHRATPNPGTTVTLLAGHKLLADLPARGQSLGRRSLQRLGIALVEGPKAQAIGADHIRLDDGRAIAADAVIVATGAAAPPLLRACGLAVDAAGFLRVRPTLQAEDDDHIFAAGDCVTLIGQERSKAGVYAVRQGPVLAANLSRAAQSRPLRFYDAQSAHLMLLALADGSAIAARGRFALKTRLAFRLKDHIDRRFVARFSAPT